MAAWCGRPGASVRREIRPASDVLLTGEGAYGVMDAESQAVAIQADRLSRLIDLSRGLMLGGRTVDLDGLRDRVGALSARMLDLPPDKAREILPRIADIAAALERLEALVDGRPDASGHRG